jgi:hypothetical protein
VPTGGQFAPTYRPAARSLGLAAHDEEDLDELVPQANSVSKIATVVDAIAAGCVEEPDIAEAIGLSARQGAYYPHAATALGFVEKTGGHPSEWGLTAAGEKLFRSAALERAEAIASDRNVVALIDGGPEALAESWSHLSGTTTARRTATTAPGSSAPTRRRPRSRRPSSRARCSRRRSARRPSVSEPQPGVPLRCGRSGAARAAM